MRQGASLDHVGESAARSLASLDVQANQFTRPAMVAATSGGKMLFDELIAGYARHQDLAGKLFVLRDLMDASTPWHDSGFPDGVGDGAR